ncbi:MAG TPA: MarR family transcriptional regulator [Methanocorpusculum sp.]|nr:MarR family transcriptional regulator [Methanocorpusculum sp.]HJK01773.1 MarR family transcriptional regulator [Methanocorpusculum sp.]
METNVLAHIREKPEGVYQNRLWKDLGVDSRTCSRILKKLEDSGYIKREECKNEGNRTYLVHLIEEKQTIDPMLLMAGEVIVPCVACDEECDIELCKMLEDWMYELVFSEMEEII